MVFSSVAFFFFLGLALDSNIVGFVSHVHLAMEIPSL
jgi:hypothetical protein